MANKCLYICLISVSAVSLILSICAFLINRNVNYLIDEQIKKQAPLIKGSKILEKWSNPSEDTEFKFTIYLFNVTNPDGIKIGEKPTVQEVGPYEFIQNKNFTLYDWLEDDKLLNFRMKTTFFRDKTCKGNLDDEVTILNVPLASMASLIKSKTENTFFFKPVSDIMRKFLRQSDLFVSQKVGDILFDGYKDSFTSKISFILNLIKFLGLKIDSPSKISKDGYFSLFGQKNNSDFGLWTINTGKKDLNELGKLIYLNGEDAVQCWTGNCKTLHGTDGLIHSPGIKDTDTLSLFEPELNRTVYLNYERNTEYKGLPTKRFVLSNLTYAAPAHNPNNQCFCPVPDDLNKYDGTLRVAHCNFNIPIVFSNPHFYQADQYFFDHISGFHPNKEKHESFADISAELGIVLNGRKAVQLNMDTNALKYYKDPDEHKLVREVFPILWLSDSGAVGPSSISELKMELYDKVENIKIFLVLLSSLFLATFAVSTIFLIFDLNFNCNAETDVRSIISNNNNGQTNLVDNQTDANNVNLIDNQTNSTITILK